MKVKIAISLDPDIFAEMKKLADAQGIGVSTLINAMLRGGLDTTQNLVAALGGMSIDRLISMLANEGQRLKKKKGR